MKIGFSFNCMKKILGSTKQGSNVCTTPLRQWGFQKCLPFSLTALRGKHCRHPIAVTGVVDTFEQDVLLFMTLQGNLYFEFKCFKN